MLDQSIFNMAKLDIAIIYTFIPDCRQGDLPFPGLRVPIDGCSYDVVPSVNSDAGGEYFNICLGLRLQHLVTGLGQTKSFCSINQSQKINRFHAMDAGLTIGALK